MSEWDPWSYRAQVTDLPIAGVDLAGYDVEAANGMIGTVQGAIYQVGSCCLLVDAGRSGFGGGFLVIPAGTIERIEVDRGRVCINLTTDQVKNAPPFVPATYMSIGYRRALGEYYERYYGGCGA